MPEDESIIRQWTELIIREMTSIRDTMQHDDIRSREQMADFQEQMRMMESELVRTRQWVEDRLMVRSGCPLESGEVTVRYVEPVKKYIYVMIGLLVILIGTTIYFN